MSQGVEPTGGAEQSIAEVDRIRDIIFGTQMRSYEQQFKRIATHLDQLGRQIEELRDMLQQQRSEQETLTREVRQELLRRHDELETSFVQQTAQVRLETHQSLEQLHGDLSKRLEQQGAESKAQAVQMGTELRKLGQDLRSELTTALEAMDQNKAGRQQVGDLLVEVGMRLKEQKGIADLLGQLVEKPGRQPGE